MSEFLETYKNAQTYDPELTIDTLWEEMKHHSPYFHLERLVFLSAIGLNDEFTMGIKRASFDAAMKPFDAKDKLNDWISEVNAYVIIVVFPESRADHKLCIP